MGGATPKHFGLKPPLYNLFLKLCAVDKFSTDVARRAVCLQ